MPSRSTRTCRRVARPPRARAVGLDDDEAHRRRRAGAAAVDVLLEEPQDLGAAPLPPSRRRRDGGAVREAQRVGQRVRGHLRLVVVRPGRLRRSPAAATSATATASQAARFASRPRTSSLLFPRPEEDDRRPGLLEGRVHDRPALRVERHGRARRRPVLARHGVLGDVALPARWRSRRGRSRPAPSRARSSRAPRRCRRPTPSAPATRRPCCRAPAATGPGSSRCARRPRATPRGGRPRCRRARGSARRR